MHNPCRGIVTSEHEDDGGYRRHRGRDIGTRDLNSLLMPVWVYAVGRPVYAAFSGRWKRIHRGAKHKSTASTWAPTRTGDGGLIANPDGEGQGYNHVAVLPRWKVGDWIDEGDLIGHLNLSGNMSAPHLHFECWAKWQDPYSDFSPKILFDKYGVDTMDDPAAKFIHSASPATITPKEDTLSAAEVNQIVNEIKAAESRIKAHLDNSLVVQADGLKASLLNPASIAAAVWDHPLTYRDQSRGTDREVPAGQHQHYQSWGNAKIIDWTETKGN